MTWALHQTPTTTAVSVAVAAGEDGGEPIRVSFFRRAGQIWIGLACDDAFDLHRLPVLWVDSVAQPFDLADAASLRLITGEAAFLAEPDGRGIMARLGDVSAPIVQALLTGQRLTVITYRVDFLSIRIQLALDRPDLFRRVLTANEVEIVHGG